MTAVLGMSVALVLALSLAGAVEPPQDEGDFEPIFNGEDLSGWEGDPSLWSVEDGAITGKTSADAPLEYNKFLVYRGDPVRNFELRAQFRLIGDNNSGIQYRSNERPEIGEYSVGGYQADIHPDPRYLGMLYDERGRGIVAESGQRVVVTPEGEKVVEGELEGEVPEVDLEEWNELTIIARGPRLVHRINGRTVVEVIDRQASERELEGLIALQVHAGPPMTVQFKDLRLRRLPEGEGRSKKARVREEAERPRDAAPVDSEAPPAADLGTLKVADGFEVELLYSVPAETQGSWVAMTVDPEGRLIVSDQYGKLYRVTPPPVGEQGEVAVEPIDVEVGEAQGLLWAFDSLYVMVNTGGRFASGLYRVRDTDGDDALDTVEQLHALDGRGEHGPHAIVPSPQGDALFVVCGNGTQLTDYDATRVPPVWGEDQLLPRMPDGNGFMADVLAPGGCIYRVDPDGREWELISMGYRNPYDLAFNREGELFTYDADMEWDINTPWYRPTRINHVVSGSDYGWRNGAGKWPSYYLDSLPAVVDIGPGSPTGIAFGYDAKFPARYQDALFICDWSYGKLYAVHLEPSGATYTATTEEFLTGTPLPLTDLVINPADGAMYVAVGGRRTSSSLYRVRYTGGEPIRPTVESDEGADLRELRRTLEAYHGRRDSDAIGSIWPHLGHPDRFVRYAARVAIEFQNGEFWHDRALAEVDPQAAANALLALIRVSAPDPAHREPADPPVDLQLKQRILDALDRLAPAWEELTATQKLDLLRVYAVLFNRMGPPDDETRARLVSRFDPAYPAQAVELNAELARLLIYLQAPNAATKTVSLLDQAPTQEEQINYAQMLRILTTGWTPELRETYFRWFLRAANYRGGSSFANFVRNIKNDAVATLSDDEAEALRPTIEAQPEPASAEVAVLRPFVKEWSLDELIPRLDEGLDGGRDYDRGRRLFAETTCFSCHRYAGEGGAVGPDLTGVAGRFSPRDLIESIIHPSKEISDQYQAVMIATEDGRVVTGRIVNLNGDNLMVMSNMLDPNALDRVERSKIEEMRPSPVSMMPEGLLNTLDEEEVFDLLAYLLSRGDREAERFE
ncbi:family 16 glycoside hydrolase [Tautonia plasticadhaerens]|uniref:family 16 glycoside hydrolase n=1 Tax=Tautonia plasticadhaerens TaxID=2527974 RepID=UPI0018D2671C|nr:family 16 glycoside hydrolase [Tautonia plasticadhaerens]